MEQKSNKTGGCAWIFVFGLFAFILSVLIQLTTGLSFLVSFILSFFIALFITQKLVGTSNNLNLFKNVISVFLMVVALRFLLIGFIDFLQNSLDEEHRFRQEEGVGITQIVEYGDTINVYASHRVWQDNYGNDFNSTLTVREKDYRRLFDHVSRFRPRNPENFWGELYNYLEQTDSPSLDLVLSAFENIQKEERLNSMEFAEMIVSCVQDIPYSFVFQDECKSPEYYEEAIRVVLEACPDCCIGDKTYGIQNPVAFIQNLKGDCDTRTVLVYSLLKYFNYDVAILNSDFYLHSVIGLHVPGQGAYKTHRGKRYYVWETTAKYFTLGRLPSNFNDLTHWNVILTSK